MLITFTYIAKVIREYSFEEIVDNVQNDKIIEYFSLFEADIASFLDLDIPNLTVTGGRFGFTKIDSNPRIGFEASVEISRVLNELEIAKISSQMTDQMDELHFGPDGLYCDLKEFGCYILPVHPELEKRPILVTFKEST